VLREAPVAGWLPGWLLSGVLQVVCYKWCATRGTCGWLAAWLAAEWCATSGVLQVVCYARHPWLAGCLAGC